MAQTNFPLLKAKTAGGTATPTGIEQTGDDPPDDPMNADPGPYPEPYKARLAQTRALMEQQPTSLFTPEQIGQRQYANDRDYKVGMLAMLGAGGNQGMEQLGGTLFKNALAQRQPQVTERGAYDPQTGQWTLNPDYQQEKHRLEYGHVEDLDAAARMHWAQQQQSAADRRAAATQSQNATRSLREAMLYGPGGMSGGGTGTDALVEGIGNYKLDAAQALSRMPPFLRNQVMAQVQTKFPDYNPAQFKARQTAGTAFTTGPQGNALRSFAVAGQHLDQLGGLVDALHNNDVQLFNKLGNAWATATGDPTPTNFEAAKDIVSKEVVKAIVAGGGGVSERQELADLMKNIKSPAQLKGVISNYRSLMSAQHDALITQRRATGLPDSMFADYTGGGQGGGGTQGGKPTVHVNY